MEVPGSTANDVLHIVIQNVQQYRTSEGSLPDASQTPPAQASRPKGKKNAGAPGPELLKDGRILSKAE